MARAVYIKRGPGHRLLGPVALAIGAGAIWLLWQTGRQASRYRGATITVVAFLTIWLLVGDWLPVLAAGLAGASLNWRVWRPASFDRWVRLPFRFACRRGRYRRQWRWLTFGNGLSGEHVERVLIGSRQVTTVPRLRRIRCSTWIDHLTVRPLVGQSVEQWEKKCEELAMAMEALECRIVSPQPGLLRLDVLWADPLEAVVPALRVSDAIDLAAVPVGLREDGTPWAIRLTANHLLVAGVTGAGKSSVVWSIIHGIAPAVAGGRVQLWGLDPKGGMEYTPGRPLFVRFAAGDVEQMADLLADAVAVMQERAGRYAAGHIREHVPSSDEPLIVVLVDEMAFLTAYAPDRQLREAINKSLATLLSQGRAVGVCVVAALQDPRKEVIGYRNLFPTKIALRLDEKTQVDMVLGDGARDAGARCDRIPEATPGIAYVRDDGVREPARVRAGYVTDDDIAAAAAAFPAPVRPAQLRPAA